MTSNRAHSILGILFLCLNLGCQKTPENWNPSQPFKTQIVVGTSSGTEFRTVELEGVQDQKTLRGDVVEFYLSPGEKSSELVGRSAIARFVKDSDGVHIPANSLSLQMVSLYYHMQSLRQLEVSSFGKTFVQWPRKIGLRVQSTNAETRFNNAFYNSELDVIFFVPYINDQLPLPLNGGVIAHEHFHSYFASKVLKDIEKPDQVEEYILKSINEGLADVWGWIYSGQPDFISQSLPEIGQFRKLDSKSQFGLFRIKSKTELEKDLDFAKSECEKLNWCTDPKQVLLSLSYINGTSIARTLKKSLDLSQLSRVEKANKIFELLNKVRELNNEKKLDLESLTVEWSRIIKPTDLEICENLKQSILTKTSQDLICSE